MKILWFVFHRVWNIYFQLHRKIAQAASQVNELLYIIKIWTSWREYRNDIQYITTSLKLLLFKICNRGNKLKGTQSLIVTSMSNKKLLRSFWIKVNSYCLWSIEHAYMSDKYQILNLHIGKKIFCKKLTYLMRHKSY